MNKVDKNKDAIHRYPDAGLKEQVRDYNETFSVATLLKETFFEKKT